ncbi:MAG: discoidin domain-containing protein [Prosthecobacter sp.]
MNEDPFYPEKLIAAGPAAKVYCGVEVATGRRVLIKVLHEIETPHELDREKLQFLAPALLQIRHPHIAGLIALAPAEDEFALIYEFMSGMNFLAFAAARKASPEDLRALAVQLMHALLVGEHLRQPHGDLKPSNLILADHPGGGLFVQVQDWGLSLTRSGHPLETLWFRAPERHAGGPPTSCSDLFTVGASLFCLATNSTPAQGDDVAELVQQWNAFEAASTLRHLRPDLDDAFIDWLAWLLRPDPRQRPQCVAQALEVLMPSTPSVPFQTPPTESGKPTSSVRRFIVALLNLTALALVGFFVWPFVRDTISARAFSSATVTGRYVRIEIPTNRGILNLAEVEVFCGGKNIAPQGKADQSSVSNNGTPDLAIDGNTDGNMTQGKSVSHTHGNKRGSPWWQVDLGKALPIQRIVIWNRTDENFGDRTTNLTLQVLDAEKKVVWQTTGLPKPDPKLEIVPGG